MRELKELWVDIRDGEDALSVQIPLSGSSDAVLRVLAWNWYGRAGLLLAFDEACRWRDYLRRAAADLRISEKETFVLESDGLSLKTRYDNQGDPYREGVSVALVTGSGDVSVFVEQDQLANLANQMAKMSS